MPAGEETAVSIKNLQPRIAPIRHINPAFSINVQAVRHVKFAGGGARAAPLMEETAVRRKVHNSAVQVAIADVKRAIRGHGHIGGPVEMGGIAAGHARFTKRQQQIARAIELENLVQPHVG